MTEIADPDDEFDPFDKPDDEDDEFERLAEACGSRRKRQCDLAGTEWCDFQCPLHDEVFPPLKRRAAALSQEEPGRR